MNKANSNYEEEKILSPEELCIDTKNTLKSYIKANAFIGFTTGFAAGGTLVAVSIVDDTKTKSIVGAVGSFLTAVSLGMTIASLTKMNDFIDNHDDAAKLHIIGQFLNTKGEDAKDELIDSLISELHDKNG